MAGAEGRPGHIRHAAVADPDAAATLTLEEIWTLCDEMVKAHGNLVPEPLRRTGLL